jgi:parvulin-like peptidyl-prolyl isomerase
MAVRWTCIFLLACLASAQPNASDSETVIATINGKKFTAGQFDRLLANMSAQAREAAKRQPLETLQEYALFENLVAEAEEARLDQQTPYREQIRDVRRQILAQARVTEHQNSIRISPAEIAAYYERNRAKFNEARAKVIFLSAVYREGTLDGKPVAKRNADETRQLSIKIMQLLKSGEDFVAIAKEHSDDENTAQTGADFPDPIRSTSAAIPQAMRDAILSAKTGDILGPFEHDTGYYIFRVESVGVPPLIKLKEQIATDLKNEAMRQWLENVKSRSAVKVENAEFFTGDRK